MHRGAALVFLASGIVATLAVSVILGIALFIASGFLYYLGARVEGEE